MRYEEGSYVICDTCAWEDDPLQAEQPDLAGGANLLGLNQFKRQWEERKSRQDSKIQNPKLP